MTIYRHLSLGLRALKGRAELDDEIDEEVRDFFERARADLVRQGMSPEEASRVVRRKLGDARRAGEDVREYGWENVAESIFVDLKHALRRLRQNPTFTVVGVLTLAVGIGASTAIFSAVSPILLEPLPYPNADRLVMVTDRTGAGSPLRMSYGTVLEVDERSSALDGFGFVTYWNPVLSGVGDPEQLTGNRVGADYFQLLGVSPVLGRSFVPEDHTPGRPQLAVVSEGFAKRRFGSAADVLNRTINLDGLPHTVVGVMPDFVNVITPGAEVWAALQVFPPAKWANNLSTIARLRPGVNLDDAQRELTSIAATPVEEFPRPQQASLRNGLFLEPLQGSVTAGARPVLLAVAGSVLLLLVLACANVTNLLLARSVARRRELAVRAVLGARRPRLVRQLLTETLVLACLGGAVGLALAAGGVRGIIALAPPNLPRLDAVALEWRAFVFAFCVTALIGIVVGLAPALRGARPDLRPDLQTGGRAASDSRSLLRHGLVVIEVALSLVLLIGAGLLLRSVEKLYDNAPGFDSSNLLTMQIVATGYAVEQTADGLRRRPDADTLALFKSMLEAVRAVPGVADAAFTTQLPLSGRGLDYYGTRFESDTEKYDTAGALRYVVAADYFRAMRIPLLRGRLLDAQDRPGGIEAVVLSESFAKRRFGNRDPIGERLKFGPELGDPNRPWDVVVGVVADVKQSSLGAPTPPDAFYVTMGQWPWVDLEHSLVVRTYGDAAALVPAIKNAIWSVSAIPAVARVATMDDLIAASEAERRFVLKLFGVFAAAALVLAALGLYGIIAGSVAERTREIGLRAALGATPEQIRRQVVRRGMMLGGLGVVIGLVGAAAATRGLESLLYGVTSLDPLTYGAVITVVAVVAVAASWLPAARAARVDPTVALRTE
jgi:putative ABC transport system permease protein